MADSSSLRPSRSSTVPPRRDDADSGDQHPASDPLAELARLIGQDETLRELTRNARSDGEPQKPAASPEPHTPPWLARSAPQAPQWRDEDEGHDPYAPPAARSAAHVETHDRDQHDRDSDAAEHEQKSYAGEHAHADDQHPSSQHAATPHGTEDNGAYYGDDQVNLEDDDYVEDRAQRRRGLITLGAVLGVLVLGAGGAFGYWTWWSGPRGEPPLIKADAGPNKVVPATQSGDNGSSKPIVERIGQKAPSAGEQMVSREEQPVDVKPPPPRQIPPGSGLSGPTFGQPAMAAPPTGVPASATPRPVKVEIIKPDQTAAADPSQMNGSPLPSRPVSTTMINGNGAPPPPAPAARPGQKQAPLVLGVTGPAAQQPEPPARAAPTGGYFVQLSSQKSEEEAQASYRTLQSKYSLLANREPTIRRADLGAKGGVVYRAQVGPFPSQDEANRFCSVYKVAGGQCLVQKY